MKDTEIDDNVDWGGKFKKFMKDLTAGFVAGAISTYVGHPLDTIKVRMQVSDHHTSIGKSMLNIIRNEGIRGLYKGVLSPVIGYAPVNAVLFAANDLSKRITKNWNASEDFKIFFSGCFGGLASCGVVGPSELLKIKKQGNEEGIRGMYSGIMPTIWRDVPTFGAYFYSYDYFQKLMKTKEKESKGDKPRRVLVEKAIAGGLAGQVCWITSYPLDVIKSYIQYHPEHTKMIETGKHIYKKHGIKHFFKGLSPCLLRAFPVNAIVFVVYEKMSKMLEPF